MANLKLLIFLALLTFGTFLTFKVVDNVEATTSYTVCHHNPANQITLNFQNLQAYLGHLGQPHSGQTYDTPGACPSVAPSPSPSSSPSRSPYPSKSPSPSPSASVYPSPSVSPSPSVYKSPSPSPSASVYPSPSASPSVYPSKSPSPSPSASVYTDIKKYASNNYPTPGEIVTFKVIITLKQALNNVEIEDIFSSGGRAPDTDFVPGSAILDGNSIPDPTLLYNQLHRVHYVFKFNYLNAGTHILTYQWKMSPLTRDVNCYQTPGNEVHLNAVGVTGHIDTSTIRLSYKCASPSPSASPSKSPSPSPSVYQSPSPSLSPSPSPSVYQSPSPSASPSRTPYPSKSPSPSPSVYQSPSPSPSVYQSPSPSVYSSPSVKPSKSPYPSYSPKPSYSPNPCVYYWCNDKPTFPSWPTFPTFPTFPYWPF